MKINHNIPAMRTLNEMNKVNQKAADSMLRLSSGLRINSAADDAAGLAIANKMDAQIKGLRQANRNTMDGVSMVQTAEGALNEVHAILQRTRELAVQAANGTYSQEDRDKIQQEINELTEEINRIGETTEFNTKPLLKGEDDKTDLFIHGIELSGGDATTKATGELVLRDPMSEEGVKDLEGKKITVGGVEIIFYDPANTNPAPENGIDISTLTDVGGNYTASISQAIVTQVGETPVPPATLPDPDPKAHMPVTAEIVGNKIVFTAKKEGVEGNKLTVNNGGLNQQVNIILQVGANEGQIMEVEIGDMRADALGITGLPGEEGYTLDAVVSDGSSTTPSRGALNVSTQEGAEAAITKYDEAISKVSNQRSKLGAVQNRLEHTTKNLGVSEENLTASMSRIQDADMAHEMAQYTQQNVISQAATAMLAQANQRPQQVLQLLQR